MNKSKTCKLGHRQIKIDVHYPNGIKIIFKKNNIIEIPNWTKNECKINEIYGTGKGYLFTGAN